MSVLLFQLQMTFPVTFDENCVYIDQQKYLNNRRKIAILYTKFIFYGNFKASVIGCDDMKSCC